MKIIKVFLLIATILVSACSSYTVKTTYNTPQNLALLKQQINAYYDSGGYDQAVTQVVQKAFDYLEYAKNTPGKIAVVFDIDDTLICSIEFEKEINYDFSVEKHKKWIINGKPSPIIPMQKLYNYIKQLKIPIILITGREESLREITINELHKNGYSGWSKLLMGYSKPGCTTGNIKTMQRKELTKKNNYRIIINIGDQYSDLTGGYTDMNFKLPNPMYFTK
jgi:predicted secreted acid phosphatase